MDDDLLSACSERGSKVGSIGTNEAENELRKKIIQGEERHVRKARFAVAAAILVCTVAVSTAVYTFSVRGEYNSFTTEYELHIQDMRKLVQWEVQYNFALMQQLSASVTTAAVMTGVVFPNLTQPYFEIAGGYVDGLGGIITAGFAPLIKGEECDQWDEYSVNNQWWLADSETLRTIHPDHIDPMRGTIQDHERSTNQDHDHGIGQDHDHGSSHETNMEIKGYVEKVDQDASPEKTPDFYRARHLSSSSPSRIAKTLFRWENGTRVKEDARRGRVYAPLWQISPPNPVAVNVNLFSDKLLADLFDAMAATNQTVLSPATEIGDMFDFLFGDDEKNRKHNPHTFLMQPVYASFAKNARLVGVLVALTAFENLLDKLLPEGSTGIDCVISDSCGHEMTYRIIGQESSFLGYGDHHDHRFTSFQRLITMESYENTNGLCVHTLAMYPTDEYVKSFQTSKPMTYTSVVSLAFLVTSILLIVYDKTVTRQQEKTMKSALRSGALVESLFPANVRDRVMDSTGGATGKQAKAEKGFVRVPGRAIADLFPNTTLMFADISGFTAWSSTREPFQVFELLETLYGAFDAIAKRRRIFKVETVGDCYVAASGLPVARDDHAVAMARFARDCLYKMNDLTRQLEVALGPDTSALAFRIGLHSGPVTGGVLRGENARFQLFGDTVNTTARMESTGLPHRIHISQTTADLLVAASKSNWVIPRDEVVHAKGKGEMKTYWLVVNDQHDAVSSNGNTSREDIDETYLVEGVCGDEGAANIDPKMMRLVEWNSEVLLRLLKLIVAQRGPSNGKNTKWQSSVSPGTTVLDEVAEIITLPGFNGCRDTPAVDEITLGLDVEAQLRSFVFSIASRYNNDTFFHNFEHASHVTMSVSKLLGRIVAPSNNNDDSAPSALHDHTYGITSDPLTQFACVFSAIIHDVDHPGVPNAQLVKEQTSLALAYKNKSVAEQNSVDIAWGLLMEPRFEQLRSALCSTVDETRRFRKLVVNAVMATDIVDKQLKAIRDGRWNRAFSDAPALEEPPADTVNRKATIVIEHLLLASDVCHTMQHWHVYRKWNERLFMEMSKAYAEGRAEKDPAETWYEGEIVFFDFYIIPLAKKLAQCGVFGVSSDEYLNYATKNREEWQLKGQQLVSEMVESLRGDETFHKRAEL